MTERDIMHEQSQTKKLPGKYVLALVFFALLGVILIYLVTSHNIVGISADSIAYISTARNLIAGDGFVRFDGNPVLVWPPMYPLLLALIGSVFKLDPLFLTNIINALIFGFIVYAGGVLFFKHFKSYPFFALMGTLVILVSIPLFEVTVMVWSEPLFILFVLLSLIFADLYLSKKDVTSLILLALSVAAAAMTRYIGVVLIIWGAMVILIFRRDNLKNRIAHFLVFALISILPIGLWLIRNYSISGTLFGPRASSVFSLSQNLQYISGSLITWHLPEVIAESLPILIFLGVAAILISALSLKDNRQSLKARLLQIGPMILFIAIYVGFLLTSSTLTAYDQINNRLLSPIYAPITVLLFLLIKAFVNPLRRLFSEKIANAILLFVFTIWLIYPISTSLAYVENILNHKNIYNGRVWMESETIQYLNQHPTFEAECTIYTNSPDAAYLQAQLITKRVPSMRIYNSTEKVNDLASLRGSWPEEDNACLVWFDNDIRNYLITMDELKTVVDMELVAQLNDGAIYYITRK